MRLSGALRIAGGIGVVGVLTLLGAAMIPSYLRNLDFQRQLDEISMTLDAGAQPADVARIQVLDRAARLGIPLRSSQVKVTPAGDRFRIEAPYVVRVDLLLYTVDLHFRPRAGAR